MLLTLLKNLEEIVASAFISVTVLVVIINVILRYGFGFVVPWSEELAVVCFIWAVYLGVSACYKRNLHMGVDVLPTLLPRKWLAPFKLMIYAFLWVFNLYMAYLSYQYTLLSSKVTPVMALPYVYINSVMVISFCLMAIHTSVFIVQNIKAITQPPAH